MCAGTAPRLLPATSPRARRESPPGCVSARSCASGRTCHPVQWCHTRYLAVARPPRCPKASPSGRSRCCKRGKSRRVSALVDVRGEGRGGRGHTSTERGRLSPGRAAIEHGRRACSGQTCTKHSALGHQGHNGGCACPTCVRGQDRRRLLCWRRKRGNLLHWWRWPLLLVAVGWTAPAKTRTSWVASP